MNILIIGGTSGLGLEIAKKFSEQSAGVYVTGRRELEEADLHNFARTCSC